MEIQAKKWGHSWAVRLPSLWVKTIGLHEGSRLEIDFQNAALVIRKKDTPLEALLAKITSENRHNCEDSVAIGKEVW